MQSILERERLACMKSRGLLPDALRTCPYDKSHQISERRFYNHLYKCRRNWMANQALKGEKVYYLNCKFNHHHSVPVMEIVHHESKCEDRNKIRSYQVRDGAKHFFPNDYENLKQLQPDEEEIKQMYGLRPGMLISNELLGQPLSLEELKGMTSNQLRERRDQILKKVMPKEWLLRGGRMSHEEYDELLAKEKKEKAAKAALGSDDDDDWNTPAPGPGFDFWANIWDPNVRHASVPHCLSKVERKLFMKIHAKRWEKEQQERLALQRNPRPRNNEYLERDRREWMERTKEVQPRSPPASPPAMDTTKVERRRRVRFNTRPAAEDDQDQCPGAVGGACTVRGTGALGKAWGVGGTGAPGKPFGVEVTGALGKAWGVRGTGAPGKPFGVEGTGALGKPFGVEGTWALGKPFGVGGTGAVATPTPSPSPPPTSSVLVTQKVAFDKIDELAEQSEGAAGGAAAFLVENENIADNMGNYQFDDDGWVQPGLVDRSEDPYWGTGNKNDTYELTVRQVHRK